MPTSTRDTFAHGYPARHPAEVVAVLDDGGSAPRVAQVAVEEACQRGVPVRFLEVMGGHIDDEARASTEDILFSVGLRALRGHPRTHSVFEVVRGHVSAVVRQRSHAAVLVVVGQETTGSRTLAARCVAASECPVRTVPVIYEPVPGGPAASPADPPPEAKVSSRGA